MTKPNFGTKRLSSIFVFSFFIFVMGTSAKLLYAKEAKQFVAKTVVGGSEFVVLTETEGGFDIDQRGSLKEGAMLPPLCTVCVPEGSTVVLTDEKGNQVELYGPDVYDLWSLQRREYKKENVKVKEGTVAVQNVITVNGKTQPVGKPVLVPGGQQIVTDPCFRTLKFELDTTDEATAEAQAAAAIAAALGTTSVDIDGLAIDDTTKEGASPSL